MKLGVALGRLNPAYFLDVTLEAERLGYESVWLPEHLVFPVEMVGSPYATDDHPPVPPSTPVFDAFAYLSFLAGKTERIKLATHVYNLALRHPFVSARAIQTLDIVSGGRALAGVGAGWLGAEWQAAGLDFRSRGRRLDEALEVCKRLWTEEVVEHHGEFFSFGSVMFEPKPVQKPHPPVIVGGDSDAALGRAARAGDGWVGMEAPADVVARRVARLHDLLAEHHRDHSSFEVSVSATVVTPEDIERLRDVGVNRIIASPWSRSPGAIDGLRALAQLAGLTGPPSSASS